MSNPLPLTRLPVTLSIWATEWDGTEHARISVRFPTIRAAFEVVPTLARQLRDDVNECLVLDGECPELDTSVDMYEVAADETYEAFTKWRNADALELQELIEGEAMMAGMAYGIDAYNDYRGEATDEPEHRDEWYWGGGQ